ncbi:ligase-associated DNA damage response exonuclease [Solimonas marina]|uniref:Ligase-associated DNA damage response exonuclease n=1 Tax=Solimonas marina TaxID=2714601 RepID=A0A970B844_9GAMM|nr:ligase-associated DNA damage response exonuclease [Solimonas marina]NKF21036.1 ligase-associated DNA damage response exonuclease [Solimonas marina]
MTELVVSRPEGLYCPAGDFYIDPHKRVTRAVVTHAHGDHVKNGCARYWTATPGYRLLKERLGAGMQVRPYDYGQVFELGDARVSLHSAGHILGSAQVRIEVGGEVWVVSGDYKRDADPSCAPFDVQRCNVFVTEATFASPQYVWPPDGSASAQIAEWWMANRAAGHASVLFTYALGKTQRVLAELMRHVGVDETVYLHQTMTKLVGLYRREGIAMLPTRGVNECGGGYDFRGSLILVPPQAFGTPWLRRLAPYRTGFASGWMGADNGRAAKYDRGFTLSDHADWPSLLRTIEQTGARRVLAMHGDSRVLIDTLRARGLQADAIDTPH